MHRTVEPAILYFGTPVVLVSSQNEDGSPNVAPMSSACIRRVHVEEALLMEGHEGRIDPRKWRPLIMSFQQFFGLAEGTVHGSRLAEIPESMYRAPQPAAMTALPAAAAFAAAGSAS